LTVHYLQKTADQVAQEWKDKADNLGTELATLQEVAELARATQASLEETQKEASVLRCKVNDLSSDLALNSTKLEVAKSSTMNQGLRRVKELEDKGLFSLDLISGEIAPRAPIAFADVKPAPKDENPPEPMLTNAEVVDQLCADVAEIARIFDAPLVLEVLLVAGKGGTPAYWDQLAAGRAALLRGRLEAAGAAGARLEVKSGVLKKAAGPEVALRLDPTLFRTAPSAGAAAGKPAAKKK